MCKHIGAPSYHGQQKSVSWLGDEWVEDKAEEREGGAYSEAGGPVGLVSGG